MLGIGQGRPGEEILGAFRHVRNHFQKHDGFIEVIEVIGGKPGAGIDIGGAQLRRPGLPSGPVGRSVGRSDPAFMGAVSVIGASVNKRG